MANKLKIESSDKASAMRHIVLDVRNLVHSYNLDPLSRFLRLPEIPALQGLSFRGYEGQILGLLGPNGAGKTTLIKSCCGLLRPSQGDVIILGDSVVNNRQKALANMAALLEGNRNLYWRMTVAENLRYFGTLRLKERRRLERDLEELIDFFGLRAKAHELIMRLSRGMQQRVAIACALIGDPQVILLDEPTTGLDVPATDIVKDLIRKIAKAYKKFILVSTHQMDVAERVCDDIVILDKGRKVLEGDVETAKNALGGPIYVIQVNVNGSKRDAIEELIRSQVIEVSTKTLADRVNLSVTLGEDEKIADVICQLKNAGFSVKRINRQERSLEDVFRATIAR